MNKEVCFLLKSEIVDDKESVLAILDIIQQYFSVLNIVNFILTADHFNFLRRDSLSKPYISVLEEFYLNNEHIAIFTVFSGDNESDVQWSILEVKKEVRSKFARDFLVNAIHGPDLEAIEEELDYFKKHLV